MWGGNHNWSGTQICPTHAEICSWHLRKENVLKVARQQGPKWVPVSSGPKGDGSDKYLLGSKSFFSLGGHRAREGCLGPAWSRAKPGRGSTLSRRLRKPGPSSPTVSQARRNPLRDAEQPPPHLPGAPPLPNQLWSPGSGCHVLRFALPISVAAANGWQGRGSGDLRPAGSPLVRAAQPPARFMCEE